MSVVRVEPGILHFVIRMEMLSLGTIFSQVRTTSHRAHFFNQIYATFRLVFEAPLALPTLESKRLRGELVICGVDWCSCVFSGARRLEYRYHVCCSTFGEVVWRMYIQYIACIVLHVLCCMCIVLRVTTRIQVSMVLLTVCARGAGLMAPCQLTIWRRSLLTRPTAHP